jgi:hypothetical protein
MNEKDLQLTQLKSKNSDLKKKRDEREKILLEKRTLL